ncbi:MAG: hypothetical protein FJX29_06645, partial [Alphaproteobacteria bacterium]|nr:hypothetical protein [Alphaproteobacteria bacterium]
MTQFSNFKFPKSGQLLLSRRAFTLGAAALCASATLPALAQSNVPLAELMVPAALPDNWVGNKDAKVTIIEYASLTCSHCAA